MIKIYADLIQGSDDWLKARCGLLTASEMKKIITPTLKVARNDEERKHLYELLAQRITNYVEPSYISDDMLRGQTDEVDARLIYSDKITPVSEVGFMTNDFGGSVTIGYSPDGLVGKDGLIECKSRKQKYQIETILSRSVPKEYILQIQTGLMVSGRKWLDFISYCGGLPMVIMRVYPDAKIQDAILEAAITFEEQLQEKLKIYNSGEIEGMRLIPTERRIEQEMFI